MALNFIQRQNVRSFLRLRNEASRFFSPRLSSTAVVSLDIDSKNGFGVLTMQKPPVNSLNMEVLQELTSSLEKAAEDRCKGLVITSSLPTIFSGGLDIMEMYNTEVKRFQEFWTSLQELWIQLQSSPVPTVALINGHAPAGGCMISMCCDYRVMVGPDFTIGLNETLLGIVIPTWFKPTMEHIIGTRQTDLALQLGRMFTAPEALKVGLIDDMVDSKEAGMTAAIQQLEKFSKIPATARIITKNMIRQPIIDKLDREADLSATTEFLMQPFVQKSLGKYMEALKKKK